LQAYAPAVLDHNWKIDALAGVPLFSRCSRSELGRIAKIADELDLKAGKTLTREGERGREFFVILEGEADVRSDTRLMRPLGPGDFFGEIALVTDAPRTATVTALTPVRSLVITDRAFRQLMRDSPQIQGKVLEAVADRLAASTL
jgi:CRP/FNR family transcriptional regulator, cyclic AMP receptor protein